MKFHPCFKNVVIEYASSTAPVPSSSFFVPESVSEYSIWKVVEFSSDCSLRFPPNATVVVLHHLVKEIRVDGRILNVVPENAIVLISDGD